MVHCPGLIQWNWLQTIFKLESAQDSLLAFRWGAQRGHHRVPDKFSPLSSNPWMNFLEFFVHSFTFYLFSNFWTDFLVLLNSSLAAARFVSTQPWRPTAQEFTSCSHPTPQWFPQRRRTMSSCPWQRSPCLSSSQLLWWWSAILVMASTWPAAWCTADTRQAIAGWHVLSFELRRQVNCLWPAQIFLGF